jgi:guanylate kinase
MIGHYGKIFVVSGPSGAGKTSLVSLLMARLGQDYKLERIITYTTRTKRDRESDFVDYRFIPEDEFKQKIETGFFIEWSQAYGAYYGSPMDQLEKLHRGTSLIMIMDVPGALHMIKNYNACSIWVAPPTLTDLKERLHKRGDSEESHTFRLELAYKELADSVSLSQFEHTIVNNHMSQALDEFEMIVRKELMRPQIVFDESKAVI